MSQTYLSIGKEGVQNNPQKNKRGKYKVCYSNPENTPRKPVKNEILVSMTNTNFTYKRYTSSKHDTYTTDNILLTYSPKQIYDKNTKSMLFISGLIDTCQQGIKFGATSAIEWVVNK